jgi:hypothetical protein
MSGDAVRRRFVRDLDFWRRCLEDPILAERAVSNLGRFFLQTAEPNPWDSSMISSEKSPKEMLFR